MPAVRTPTPLLRELRPGDEEALRAFHRRLSPTSIWYRWLHPVPDLPPSLARHLVRVDGRRRIAVGAFLPPPSPGLVGVARCDRLSSSAQGELAVVVDDAYQGQGIGRMLVEAVGQQAARAGIHVLCGLTAQDNVRFLRLLRSLPWPVTVAPAGPGTLSFRICLASGATCRPAGISGVSAR